MATMKKANGHLALIKQAKLVKMVQLMAHQLLTRSKRKARSQQKIKVNNLQVLSLNKEREENQILKMSLQL